MKGVLIVLAGGQLDDGRPTAETVRRCLRAVELWKEERYGRIVVTGGSSNRPRQPAPLLAHVMAALLYEHGVPPEAVKIDAASSSTRQSAVNTARLLAAEAGPFVLITSDYHCRRACGAFARAGLSVAAAPVPHQGDITALPLFSKERVKLLYYRLRGWLATQESVER